MADAAVKREKVLCVAWCGIGWCERKLQSDIRGLHV